MITNGQDVSARDGAVDRALGLVRDIRDYPEPGIVFKDITPLLGDPAAFRAVVTALAAPYRRPDASSPGRTVLPEGAGVGAAGIEVVAAIEARGFILGAPLALELGAAFVPLRKRGKLPHTTVSVEYELEYGTAEIEVHADAIQEGQRVLVVDDVLATGGTAAAACELVERIGGRVVALTVLMELGFLCGRDRLAGREIRALFTV